MTGSHGLCGIGVCLCGMSGLLLSAWAAVADPPPSVSPPPGGANGSGASAAAVQPAAAAAPAAPNAASVMDAPLRMIAEAGQTYQNVRDYTCLFIKHEQINGQLQPENIMSMRVRAQPFSVYFRWLAPKDTAGQEVCYVAGRNNGMMRVHVTGLRGMAGFVSIDPRDARAMQASRYSITEAGIGSLIEMFRQRWELERRLNKTQVRIADYEFNKRPCTRVETIHLDPSGGQIDAYRHVLYFDKETRLPVRMEVYDWPRRGGPPEGDLLECYSYVDLRFNVGLGDDAFRY